MKRGKQNKLMQLTLTNLVEIYWDFVQAGSAQIIPKYVQFSKKENLCWILRYGTRFISVRLFAPILEVIGNQRTALLFTF